MFKLNKFYFFISLVIGLLFVYLFTPQAEVIIRYPTPENAGKLVYQDKNDTCYKYKANEIQCPADKSLINDHYLQKDGVKKNKFSIF